MFGAKKDNLARKMVKLFTKTLDQKKIKYDLHDERPVVFLKYQGENFNKLTFTFFFDDDGHSLSLKVYTILKFQQDQLASAYIFANEMNKKYRWIRFYIDDDNELTADIDAVISESTVGEGCYELLSRAVDIVDEVCGILNGND